MKYSLIFWLIWIGLMLLLELIPKKSIKLRITVIVVMLGIFFAPMFLPRQIFGTWNAISNLNGKTIAKILLRPSEPKWKVNLVDSVMTINDKDQIDSLILLLQKSEVYFSNHPTRIWETEMIFITTVNDTLAIEINKTENNGTVIYTPTNEWRKDRIGNYLERITNYFQPVLGDTTTRSRSFGGARQAGRKALPLVVMH